MLKIKNKLKWHNLHDQYYWKNKTINMILYSFNLSFKKECKYIKFLSNYQYYLYLNLLLDLFIFYLSSFEGYFIESRTRD
jgi:hypothetical protein